jgi:carbonic anhydrase
MQKLVAGIHHFQSNDFASEREFFERMALGQTPETLFITCSDSRINPNLLTNTRPGELFILRNAGNIIPPWGAANGGEGATVEYAVAALGVRDIILCGHSHCGAMKGLLDLDGLGDMPAVRSWLGNAESTRRIMRENYGHLEGESLVTATVQENVLAQLENLRTHPAVAAGVARGELFLHGWVYKIESGEVFSYDDKVEQFVPISEISRSVPTLAQPRRLAVPSI